MRTIKTFARFCSDALWCVFIVIPYETKGAGTHSEVPVKMVDPSAFSRIRAAAFAMLNFCPSSKWVVTTAVWLLRSNAVAFTTHQRCKSNLMISRTLLLFPAVTSIRCSHPNVPIPPSCCTSHSPSFIVGCSHFLPRDVFRWRSQYPY